MAKNRYYHYDHEACAFVEVQPTRTRFYAQLSGFVVGAFLLAGAMAWGIDHMTETPEELALQAENRALQQQLSATEERIEDVASQLDELAETDQSLYRVLLDADPISDDVRQAGAGGIDPYEHFSRFSAPTAEVLRETGQHLDQLERQIALQNASFRELADLAEEHQAWLTEMPAILPASGNLISGFGMRRHPILKITRLHKGVDIVAPTGTPVYATGDAVVKEAGRSAGYGINVVLEHPKAGYLTRYAHLSAANVREGQRVQRGDLIGKVGSTGLSKAPHLHYEVMNLDGEPFNPIYFFAPSLSPERYRQLLAESQASSISLD